MQVNQSVLQQIYVGFKTIFNKVLQNTEPVWKQVATLIPSSTKSEEYKWLGKIPRMREWIGDRVIQNLTSSDYTIKNKDFELTIGVERNDIEDDTIGVYNPLMEEMARSVAFHPDELVFELFHNGFSEKCYDGKPFFATNHPVGKQSISNKSTYKLTAETYGDARSSMMSQTDEHGKPLSIKPNLLVVPPQLEAAAKRIILAEKDAAGADNIYYKTADLLVVPELSANENEWYLLDTTRAIKPFIYQQRQKAKLISKNKETDDNLFFSKEFIYGADCRDNAGYGLWQLAYGSTGAQDKPSS